MSPKRVLAGSWYTLYHAPKTGRCALKPTAWDLVSAPLSLIPMGFFTMLILSLTVCTVGVLWIAGAGFLYCPDCPGSLSARRHGALLERDAGRRRRGWKTNGRCAAMTFRKTEAPWPGRSRIRHSAGTRQGSRTVWIRSGNGRTFILPFHGMRTGPCRCPRRYRPPVSGSPGG